MTRALAIALLLTACAPHAHPDDRNGYIIETPTQDIHVAGDPELFEQHAAEILGRIDNVDPLLIQPGVGLWVEETDPPGMLLVGRVVSVSTRTDAP